MLHEHWTIVYYQECKNMKARWFKGYETEVGKALAGGSSTYRPVVNYMKKHKVTLHTLLQNTILSHFRPYNYSVPYHTIPRCSLWWWMLIVRWPDAPPAPGPNQVITQWPGLITMRLITPHTIITDHLAISYNTTACWCTYNTVLLTTPDYGTRVCRCT